MGAGNSKVAARTTHDISKDIRALHNQVVDRREPFGEVEKIVKRLIEEIGLSRSAGSKADAQKWLRREFRAIRILVNVQYEIGKSDSLKAHKLDEAKENAQKALKFPLPDPKKLAKVERWKSDLKSFVSDKIDMELIMAGKLDMPGIKSRAGDAMTDVHRIYAVAEKAQDFGKHTRVQRATEHTDNLIRSDAVTAMLANRLDEELAALEQRIHYEKESLEQESLRKQLVDVKKQKLVLLKEEQEALSKKRMELSRTDSLKRDEAIRQQRLDEAASANEFGNSYQTQGQYAKALEHHTQALVIRRQVLGPQHPDVAISLRSIEACRQAQAQAEAQAKVQVQTQALAQSKAQAEALAQAQAQIQALVQAEAQAKAQAQKALAQSKAQAEALAQANQALAQAEAKAKVQATVKMETKEECQVRIDVVSTKDWAAASTMKLPPYPQALKNFLAENCTIWPGKKRSETHIVVPLFSEVSINGVAAIPLTLESLDLLDKSSGGPGYISIWNAIPKNVRADKEFCYAVMTNDVIPGSRDKPYDQQIKLLPPGYEVPGVLDATRAILWENRRSGKRYFNADPLIYTRCKEVIGEYHLVVGGFAPSGLSVSNFNCYGVHDYVGVAGWRKF